MASKENYMYGQEANELMKDKYLIKAPDNYVRYNIKYTGSLADGVTVSELFDKTGTDYRVVTVEDLSDLTKLNKKIKTP